MLNKLFYVSQTIFSIKVKFRYNVNYIKDILSTSGLIMNRNTFSMMN